MLCEKCSLAGAALAGSTAPRPTTSVEPARCSPCSKTTTSTSTPPLLHWPRTATTSYLSRIMKKKREKKTTRRTDLLTHLLRSALASKARMLLLLLLCVKKKKKIPFGAQRRLEMLRWLARPQMSPPAQRHKDGCVDLGQISAGGPHLAACRLFSPGYILGLVKAPAIKHTLLPSRAPFLSPNPLPLCSHAGS